MPWPADITAVTRFTACDPLVRGVQVRIHQTGHGWIDPDWWDSPRVVQPAWCLYRNQGPGCTVAVPGGQTVALEPGRSWLIPPWTIQARRTCRLQHQWIEADIDGPLPAGLAGGGLRPIPVPDQDGIPAAWAALVEDGPDRLTVQLRAQALALTLLATAMQGLDQAGRAPDPLLTAVGPALDRIGADPAAELGNELLAAACRLPPTSFHRLFRRATGRTPHQYVIDRRLGLACLLLDDPGQPIDRIAARCGFSDRFAFSHAFRRRFGLAPAAWRHRHRQDFA